MKITSVRGRQRGLAIGARRATRRALRLRIALASLAVLVAGCAGPSLVSKEQADGIRRRDEALAARADAIQAAIRQSGATGALAFLDANDGRLVVLPGDTPTAAWARHAGSPESAGVSPPPVVHFVYRSDAPAAPEVVNVSALRQHEALLGSLTKLGVDIGEAQRRTEQRLADIRRELGESIVAAKLDAERALAAATAESQRALRALADDLAAARAFSLQTAQLGWLNHDLTVEAASGMRKLEGSSQALSATSARLAASVQQLSETLARQLKELEARIEAIRSKMGEIK